MRKIDEIRAWPGLFLPVLLLTLVAGCASAPDEEEARTRATTEEREEPRADAGSPKVDAEPAWTRIAREMGVPRLTLEIDADEVARQEALGGKVGFEAALRAALESWLQDGGDLESPVSIFRNGPDRILDEDEARAMARKAIDQPTSRLGLVRLGLTESQPHFPQGEEDTREHWVFYLETKETHDHSHWAVVPRDGGAVYNYGFN